MRYQTFCKFLSFKVTLVRVYGKTYVRFISVKLVQYLKYVIPAGSENSLNCLLLTSMDFFLRFADSASQYI